MSSNNRLIIACAGSGKSWGICSDASSCTVDPGKRMLFITYTNKGAESLKNTYESQNSGVFCSSISVMTWHQFLLRELIKPYQKAYTGVVSGIRSIDFDNQYGISYLKKDDPYYYVTRSGNVRALHASEFVLLLNKETHNQPINRLTRKYERIYIDELQDLAGLDVDILELLIRSNLAVYCVGDPKQKTFQTHNAKIGKKKGGENIFPYLCNRSNVLHLNVELSNATRRFEQDIADFANLMLPDNPMNSNVHYEEVTDKGVYIIGKQYITDYIAQFKPIVLRYDKNSDTLGFSGINYGVCKGMTVNRVVVFANGPLSKFVVDPYKNPIENPVKYYIAVTRARYSVVIVVDKPKESKCFQPCDFTCCGNTIKALKFKLPTDN